VGADGYQGALAAQVLVELVLGGGWLGVEGGGRLGAVGGGWGVGSREDVLSGVERTPDSASVCLTTSAAACLRSSRIDTT